MIKKIVTYSFLCILPGFLFSCTDDEEKEIKDLNKKAVAHYTFDNKNADDNSENELHGVLINSPEFVTSTSNGIGKAVFLNGTKEQYINIPYNPFKNSLNYSISMWIKDFGPGIMFSAISNDYERSDYPRLIANQSGSFTLYTNYDNYGTTSPFSYQYKEIQDGKWHMLSIVCTQESTYSEGTKYLFVDGKLVDTGKGKIASSSDCTKIHIGGNGGGKYASYSSSMKTDNIRFYNSALSSTEIKAIYSLEK